MKGTLYDKIYYIIHILINLSVCYFAGYLNKPQLACFSSIAFFLGSTFIMDKEKEHHYISSIFIFITLFLCNSNNRNVLVLVEWTLIIMTGAPGILLYLSLLFEFYNRKIGYYYAVHMRFIPFVILCVCATLQAIFTNNNIILIESIVIAFIGCFGMANTSYYGYVSWKKYRESINDEIEEKINDDEE